MADHGYAEWLNQVPALDRDDPIWRVEAYRLARFAASRATRIAAELRKSPASFRMADQLHRASWSIAANLAEGYGKSSVADRLRYYEIALGSTRECIVWCSAAVETVHAIPHPELTALLSSIRRLLLTMIRNERSRPGKRMEFGARNEGYEGG